MYTNELNANKYEAINYDIDSFGDTLDSVTDDNFQVLVGVSGTTGTGKTTFTIKVAKKKDPNFKMDRNVLLNPTFAEVFERVTELPYGSYVVLDEAINICYKMEWYSNTVKAFGKFLNKCRKERKKIFFCIPNFGDISKNIRQNINIWVQVLKRGKAVFLTKSPFFSAPDRWDLKEMDRTLRKYINKRYVEVTTEELLFLIRRNKHYAGEISYTAMDEKTEAEYELLREVEKYSDLTDLKTRGDNSRNDKIRLLRFALWRTGIPHAVIGLIEGAVSGASVSVTLQKIKQEDKTRIDEALSKRGLLNKFRFDKDGEPLKAKQIEKLEREGGINA
jgi:hypothetical protein